MFILESACLLLQPGVSGSGRRLNAQMIGRPENDLRHVTYAVRTHAEYQ